MLNKIVFFIVCFFSWKCEIFFYCIVMFLVRNENYGKLTEFGKLGMFLNFSSNLKNIKSIFDHFEWTVSFIVMSLSFFFTLFDVIIKLSVSKRLLQFTCVGEDHTRYNDAINRVSLSFHFKMNEISQKNDSSNFIPLQNDVFRKN